MMHTLLPASRFCCIALPFVLAAGCSSLTGPGDRQMGIIGTEDGETLLHAGSAGAVSSVLPDGAGTSDPLLLPVLESPDTVAVSTPFEAVVRTLGPDGCWRADGARVSGAPNGAEIVPYDRISGQNCTDAVRRLARTVTLRFDDSGEAVLRVTGRIISSDGGQSHERIGSVEKRIVVR
jgi:hypothetical protein